MAAFIRIVVLSTALAASTIVTLATGGPGMETQQEKTPSFPAAPKGVVAGKPQARVDAWGDPLPDGAIRRLGTLRFRHGGNGGSTICNLLLTPDGKTLVSNDYYGSRRVCVWEMATGKLLHQFPGTYEWRNIALSPDGKIVAVGQEKAVFLCDLASGKEVRRLAQPNATGFAFSPDGKILAVGGYGPGIQLWEIASGRNTANLPLDGTSAAELAFTPDGKSLIAGKGSIPRSACGT